MRVSPKMSIEGRMGVGDDAGSIFRCAWKGVRMERENRSAAEGASTSDPLVK